MKWNYSRVLEVNQVMPVVGRATRCSKVLACGPRVQLNQSARCSKLSPPLLVLRRSTSPTWTANSRPSASALWKLSLTICLIAVIMLLSHRKHYLNSKSDHSSARFSWCPSAAARPTPSTMTEAPIELYENCRSQFPYFKHSQVAFMENAGGSQVPACTIDAISKYMSHTYVQLGAGYEASNTATKTVHDAHEVVRVLMHAGDAGEVVLGPSTSQLVDHIARSYASVLCSSDTIVVHQASHEANAGPWVRLAQATGAKLVWWELDPGTFSAPLSQLEKLLDGSARILAVPHVSNILGQVLDMRALVALVKARAPRCRVVADGVAYAPHLPMDVQGWGVDWYVFSTYKTWGPHMAALYGSHAAWMELTDAAEGPNHYFIDNTNVVYKYELGGVSHEGCAGLCALPIYLQHVADSWQALQGGSATAEGTSCSSSSSSSRSSSYGMLQRHTVELAFLAMAAMEQPLQELLLQYLCSTPGITVVGPGSSAGRVPTISFVHSSIPSSVISRALQQRGFAVRHGHMYAHRLISSLQLRSGAPVEEGVVRISLLHYNTPEEVHRLVAALREIAALGSAGEV